MTRDQPHRPGTPLASRTSCESGWGQDYPTTESGWSFHTVYGAILAHYITLGQTGSLLGEPTEERNAPGGGRENLFNGSSCGSGSAIGFAWMFRPHLFVNMTAPAVSARSMFARLDRTLMRCHAKALTSADACFSSVRDYLNKALGKRRGNRS